jgi:hypothetical protein
MINDKGYPRRRRGESCGEFLRLARRSWGNYEGVFEIVRLDLMNQRNVLNPENTAMVDDLCSEVCEEAVGRADRVPRLLETPDIPGNFTPSRPPVHPLRD